MATLGHAPWDGYRLQGGGQGRSLWTGGEKERRRKGEKEKRRKGEKEKMRKGGKEDRGGISIMERVWGGI